MFVINKFIIYMFLTPNHCFFFIYIYIYIYIYILMGFTFMGFLCLLFWEDSGEMTGKYWVERGERDQQRTSRRESNSGRCERNCATCRCTNHEAIGADQTVASKMRAPLEYYYFLQWKVDLSESGEKYALIKHRKRKQSKTVLNKYVSGF